MSGTPRVIIALILCCVAAACARREPVYNVQNHPVPVQAQSLRLDQVERIIIETGARRGWRFERTAPGRLRGSLKEKHTANIDVLYTSQAYSIQLVSSENLLQGDGMIHRNYNKWIELLERDIDQALYRAAIR